MRTKTILAAVLAAALAAPVVADAQTRRSGRARPAPPAAAAEPARQQLVPSPLTGPYSHPPGYTGTIRWDTPDANGNFSTATGGGGGGP